MSDDATKLMSMLEASMAEFAEKFGELAEMVDKDSIQQFAVDLLETIGERKSTDLAPLIAAIRAMPAPVVHVNVQPAELQYVERQRPTKWTVTIHGDNHTPDRRMTIEA
jgi:hypothetical protein